MTKVRIGIIGASGYGAGELFRLLAQHPQAEIVAAVSSSSENSALKDLHPNLSNQIGDLICTKDLDLNLFDNPAIPACIFAALPHGHSGNYALSLFRNPKLAHLKIIDLSGDLRFKNADLAHQWYPETSFLAEERAQIAYGIPEINRDSIQQARLIANPGCLASAAIYALTPIVHDQLSAQIIIDAKTGTSGAGRTPQASFHHPSMHASCHSYKVLEHRHEAEIRETLGDAHGTRLKTNFVPTVIPTSRGIYASCYVISEQLPDEGEIIQRYQSFYQSSPFIQVKNTVPELKNIVGSNYCHLYLKKRAATLFIVAALDNLVKGMAGSAIQNMNLAFGIEERCGLEALGFGII